MKKRTLVSLTAAVLSLAGTASGAEFQPMGALGIGGAGVARTTNAYAAYWNPAGLAFNETAFSMPMDVSVGLRVSKGLADNVDRLNKFTQKGSDGLSTIDELKNLNTTGSNPKAVADMVNLISVIDDIKAQKGTISVTGNAVVAMQIKHLAFGAFGTVEGFMQPLPDTVHVLPTTSGGATASPLSLYQAAGTPSVQGSYTPKFFTPDQLGGIANVFSNSAIANHLSPTDALALAQTIDAQMASNPNPTGLSNSTVYNTVVTSLQTQLANADSNTINNNNTAVLVKSLAYVEFPLSYGHPFDLGRFGKLGIGGSIKVIRGRVYESRIQLLNNGNVGSGDLVKDFTKNYEDTTAVTADVGALWKYQMVSAGIVAKNLTAPRFNSPDLKDQKGQYVDVNGNVVTVPVKDEAVRIKPQVRAGIALDPFSWLTLAADLDLTNNDTVLTGLGYKSQNVGGGLELHPLTWLKLRAGMYKNLSDSGVGPVATGGLTFGTKWVNLDIDGAYGLKTATFKEHSYPEEARLQTNLNVQF